MTEMFVFAEPAQCVRKQNLLYQVGIWYLCHICC